MPMRENLNVERELKGERKGGGVQRKTKGYPQIKRESQTERETKDTESERTKEIE